MKLLLEGLKLELMQTRRKIELGNDRLPIELGLPKVLLDMENEITKEIPDKEKLKEGSFGIFRLVTESYSFEKSSLGQDLLNLQKRIKEVIHDL